jgi:hypothetical protein
MLKSRDSALKAHLYRQSRAYWQFPAGVALVCAASFALGSCSTVLSEIPAQMGGLPAGAPARPAAPPAYPAVHDMPPPRSATVLTEEERKKVEAELAAMRAEQAKKAAAKLPE